MGLVDGEEEERAARVQLGQPREPVGHQLLGRHEDERELAREGAPLDRPVELRGAQEGGHLPPALPDGVVEALHLVGHERDERRHHDGGAACVECWKLVADGLA